MLVTARCPPLRALTGTPVFTSGAPALLDRFLKAGVCISQQVARKTETVQDFRTQLRQ